MTEQTPPSDDQSGRQPGWGSVRPPTSGQAPPNWGSAYPPPGGYPRAGGYPPPGYGYGYARPKHPNATTSMVLGIVSVVGGFLCYLPLLISPFAWYTSARTIREIDEGHGAQDGRGEAVAGKVLGIIGTVFMVLAILGITLLVVLTFTVDGFWDEEY